MDKKDTSPRTRSNTRTTLRGAVDLTSSTYLPIGCIHLPLLKMNNKEMIRGQIVALNSAGLSPAEISSTLSVSRATVYTWLKRNEEGSLKDRPRRGMPRKTTPAQDKLITEAAREQSVLNASEIRLQLQLPVSINTVRSRIRQAGIRYPDPPIRETLRDNHKNARVRFAMEHKDEGLDFWGRVIFSGEKTFSLNSKGKMKSWRWNEPR